MEVLGLGLVQQATIKLEVVVRRVAVVHLAFKQVMISDNSEGELFNMIVIILSM